ncbi:MAG: SseB family protein [Gammaproteobacteria bacterium]
MNDTFVATDLERALAELSEALATRERALIEFVKARIWLLTDGETETDPKSLRSARMAMVSDGPNLDQPMLAIFTSEERAVRFQRAHENSLPNVVAVEAPFAILCVREGAGIIINPNQSPGFRIGPEAAQMLRDQMIRLQSRGPDPNASVA